jgi:hypothetical protein
MLASQRNALKIKRVRGEPRDLAPAGSPTPEMVAGSFKSSYSQTLLEYPIFSNSVNNVPPPNEPHQNTTQAAREICSTGDLVAGGFTL